MTSPKDIPANDAGRRACVLLAQEQVPMLEANAQEIDDLRRLPDGVVAKLVDSGIVRLSNPPAFGGAPDFDLSLAAISRLAVGSPSAAWCTAVWAQHNYQVGRWPRQAQDEYFAAGQDVLCSSAFVAADAQITPVKGGFRLAGTWRFSSGCNHASWMLLGGGAEGVGPALFLVEPGDWRPLDTWYSSGLKGTGSNDVVLDGAFVPTHRVLPIAEYAVGDPDDRSGRPSYRVTPWPLVSMLLGLVVVGAAQGAVEWVGRELAGSEDLVDHALAESGAELDGAWAMCWRDIDAIIERAQSDAVLAMEDRIRLARNRAYAVRLAVSTVNRLLAASGTDRTREGSQLVRFHRDVHAGSHQPALAWDLHAVQYGRSRLGFEVQARMV